MLRCFNSRIHAHGHAHGHDEILWSPERFHGLILWVQTPLVTISSGKYATFFLQSGRVVISSESKVLCYFLIDGNEAGDVLNKWKAYTHRKQTLIARASGAGNKQRVNNWYICKRTRPVGARVHITNEALLDSCGRTCGSIKTPGVAALLFAFFKCIFSAKLAGIPRHIGQCRRKNPGAQMRVVTADQVHAARSGLASC